MSHVLSHERQLVSDEWYAKIRAGYEGAVKALLPTVVEVTHEHINDESCELASTERVDAEILEE